MFSNCRLISLVLSFICFLLAEIADIMSQLYLKRWALYPPGKVPLGVTVHVNEDDGDVNVETPSSLQVFVVDVIVLCDSSHICQSP